MSAWALFWLSLGVIGAGGEAVALARTASGDTLSEQIWSWLRVKPGQAPAPLRSWRTFTVGGLLVWLFGHFLFGWWT